MPMGLLRHKSRHRSRIVDMIRHIVDFVIRIANGLIPKDKSLIVFHSMPDYCDNPRAFYEYITRVHGQKYRCIWLVESNERYLTLVAAGINARQLNSLRGLWCFCRATYIITSHTYGVSFRVTGQTYVNLWHGMPLKAIGMLETSNSELTRELVSDPWYIVIATSQIMKSVMAAALGVVAKRVMVTGQPRNDRIGGARELALARLGSVVGKRLTGKRIVLYLPTYRASYARNDGLNVLSGAFYGDQMEEAEVSRWLEKRNIEFIVKLHPHEMVKLPDVLPDGVSMIEQDRFRESLLDLYDLLPAVDVLVTDYSSVYFDFMLLDRPIVFHVPDLDQYRFARGFALSPFEFWTPGPKTSNLQELMTEIAKCMDDPDYFRTERMTVSAVINEFSDSESCKRVYEAMIRGSNKSGDLENGRAQKL